jgi:hypothetical protein
VRVLVVVIVGATLSACGSGSSARSNLAPSNAPIGASRIERCVDRLLRQTTTLDAAGEEAARRYARKTYCARFEENGWIYEDGAVSIAAQTWLDQGATCARSSDGQPAKTVRCGVDRTAIDCALLRIVRRSEVREYIHRLETNGAVSCDDGTALDNLGVP